jgi:hypothetical protein
MLEMPPPGGTFQQITCMLQLFGTFTENCSDWTGSLKVICPPYSYDPLPAYEYAWQLKSVLFGHPYQ